jgi:16S rRNA (cytosine967-C5)-methyltransferase
VYSTCTTAREENEATVAAFLEGHSHFRLVPLPEWVPASVRTPEGFLRTWPHRHRMGGAFGALMERCE